MSAPISSAYSAWQHLDIAEDDVISVELRKSGLVRVHASTGTRDGDLELVGRFLQSPGWHETRSSTDSWVHITAVSDVRGIRVEVVVLVGHVDGSDADDTRVPELDIAAVPS